MSQCSLSENNKEYTELKTYGFWGNYLEIFEEWERDKELIKYLIDAAFDECCQNVLYPKVTKKV